MTISIIGHIVVSGHGGLCCGITHIWAFPTRPSTPLPARKKYSPSEWDSLKMGYPSLYSTWNIESPAETAGDRLKEMIRLISTDEHNPDNGFVIRRGRPDGIIEVVLTSSQADYWDEFLLELGFKNINRSVNSNSKNTVVVYHLNTGK